MYLTITEAAVKLNIPYYCIENVRKNKPELGLYFSKMFSEKAGRRVWHVDYEAIEEWLYNNDFYFNKYLSQEAQRNYSLITAPRPPKTQGILYKMFLRANYTKEYEEANAG